MRRCKHERLLRGALKNSGIAADRDEQVLLVAAKQPYWYAVLIHALYAETGAFRGSFKPLPSVRPLETLARYGFLIPTASWG